ncbi:MAG: transcriptional regulator [Alphaproteobacteria bacterium]|nr:MAG: transcriptional regulator [Alphaproteobacteria bacterium]
MATASGNSLDCLRLANFPPQVDGDLILDGVCANFITDKLGVSQPTAARHLQVLADAGLIIPTRKKGWTFYRRNEGEIARIRKTLSESI